MKLITLIMGLSILAHAEFGMNISSQKLVNTASSQVGTSFMSNKPGFPFNPVTGLATQGASTVSLIFQNIDGSNYRHLMVVNETNYPLSVLTTTTLEALPSIVSTRKLYVISNGIGTWDDITLFNNLYIMGEGGSIPNGTIEIIAWQ